MFSREEKTKIAAGVERLLLDLNHPEMPKEKPSFQLHVEGKESWSWADIDPNWKYIDTKPTVSRWNEEAREVMKAITVRWIKEEEWGHDKAMQVVESDHKRFTKGSRFDFGFFDIATTEGYTIISLPLIEPT